MLNFFRKIRQSLLSDNKFTKYLIYAIGEIVLVVIGILIALQVNNWNEYNKERAFEHVMLQKFAYNIAEDITDYNKVLEAESNYKTKIDSFLVIIRNPMNYETSDLDPYYTSLWYFQRFTPNTSAITNLLTSGNINIIKNEVLLDQILEYYKTIDQQSASVDEALATYTRNQIGPYIMKFDFMDTEVMSSEYRERKSLLAYHKDPAIENLVSARIKLMNTQKSYYEQQIEHAKNLLARIDEEIK